MRNFIWITTIAIMLCASCSEKKKCNCQCHKVENNVDSALKPRLYIVDEFSDSIYYRGEWYYLDNYNLNWVSKSGDWFRDHILDQESDRFNNHTIIITNGDTIELCYSPVRLDEYGDTIIFKRKGVYF